MLIPQGILVMAMGVMGLLPLKILTLTDTMITYSKQNKKMKNKNKIWDYQSGYKCKSGWFCCCYCLFWGRLLFCDPVWLPAHNNPLALSFEVLGLQVWANTAKIWLLLINLSYFKSNLFLAYKILKILIINMKWKNIYLVSGGCPVTKNDDR